MSSTQPAYQPHRLSLQFKAQKLDGLPARWARKLDKRYTDFLPGGRRWTPGHDLDFLANQDLREQADRLHGSRLPLDAKDSEICAAADKLAARPGELAQICHDAAALRAAMARICEGQGIAPPNEKIEHGPALARMADPLWWRRKLRRVHAKIVEGAAIDLGYVNRARDCYVSQESVWRRAEQNERNAASLEATEATNEKGQSYTLAELAAKGPANKAIRRAELMTRIAGFERVAAELGHVGLFFTMTCPSRMHKWRTLKGQGGRVQENPRYDGTLPGDAQKYLAKVWSRIRAKLARQGIGQYGFRIAEPNHDGTPHWHLLIFVEPGRLDELKQTVWHYALQDSPDEPGAHAHRVDFKTIDAGRGSAAGYIAKYVAKNIDGYKLDKDLLGNDAVEASHRVEAWAATWAVRQFQQIGGPPVGVWRELRRVESLPTGAPQHLIDAHNACNRLTDLEAGTVKAVAWDRYVKAQGGVFCGRAALVKLATVVPEGVNRYGETPAPKAIGVATVSREIYTPDHMKHMGGQALRVVEWIVESVRHVWTLTRKAAAQIARGSEPELEAAKRPWTCVNNCTAQAEKGSHERENADRSGHGKDEGGAASGPVSRQDHGGAVFGADCGSAGSHGRNCGAD